MGDSIQKTASAHFVPSFFKLAVKRRTIMRYDLGSIYLFDFFKPLPFSSCSLIDFLFVLN